MKTDAQIQQDVMEEMNWEPQLNATQIGVAVKDGIVTLSGTVDTYLKKRKAEKAAKRVKGVKAVAEDIEVKLSGFGKKNDTELAEAVLIALKWNSAVKEEKVKVKVENGWITLDGEAEWLFQRNAATRAVEHLNGVVGVTNLISIKPHLDAKVVKSKIESAFQRSASLDSDRINIETIGNRIILKGKVRSWAEKIDAENAAWKSPGVEIVENKLEIDPMVLVF